VHEHNLNEDYVDWIKYLYPAQGQWTEEDYFSLPNTEYKVELVNGELVRAPASDTGNLFISRAIFRALDAYAVEHDLGETLFAEVSLRRNENIIRQPDLLFVSKDRVGQIKKRYVETPIDLMGLNHYLW